MKPLYRYRAATIQEAGDSVRSTLEANAMHPGEFWRRQDAFRFRDERGNYLYFDIQHGRWYRHEGGHWSPVSVSPTEVLEGCAASQIPMGVPVPTPIPADTDQPLPTQGNPLDAIRTVVQLVYSRFLDGRISSRDAAKILRQRVLLDREGNAWTLGCRSGDWYYFAEGSWHQAGGPPPLESLVELQPAPANCPRCGQALDDQSFCPQCRQEAGPSLAGATEKTYASFSAFLLLGAGSMPEAVTMKWKPPRSFPTLAASTSTTIWQRH